MDYIIELQGKGNLEEQKHEREDNKMTNAQIILNNSITLMEQGILKGSGIFGTIEDKDGNKTQIELPETIHTYAAWKSIGYQVKKGQKAKAAFTIWKYAESKKQNDEEEAEGKMFMKTAHFFTKDQVEKIA